MLHMCGVRTGHTCDEQVVLLLSPGDDLSCFASCGGGLGGGCEGGGGLSVGLGGDEKAAGGSPTAGNR